MIERRIQYNVTILILILLWNLKANFLALAILFFSKINMNEMKTLAF